MLATMGRKLSARWWRGNMSFRVVVVVVVSILVTCEMSAAQQQQDASPATDPTDLQALHELMYALNFDNDWKQLFPDPCVSGPQGIVCEPDAATGTLFVTQLQFGFLSAIANIVSCSPNATLPASISSFTRLTTLSFTACFTTGYVTLPSSFPPELRFLTFSSNPSLLGTIPPSLSNLTSLTRLVLSQNGLQGEIPGELGGLHSLTQLDLSHNNLTGSIPETLSSMEGLVNLDLRWNNLDGEFPVSISQGLHQLQRLAISNNRLTGPLPDTFTGLSSVTFMDLSWNRFSGALPASLGTLTTLQDLFLNSNQLEETIPGAITELTSLVRLDLSGCAFEGVIPDTLYKLQNLRFLSVSRNHLSGSIPSSLALLPVLFTLNLDGNQLSGPVPFSPSFVQKMGRNLLVKDNPGLCYIPHMLPGLSQCPVVDETRSSTSPSPSPNGSHYRSFPSFFVSFALLLLCFLV